VVSQVQGTDDLGLDATKVDVKKSCSDADFPFYKPLVVKLNNDSKTPELYGRMLMEKQRHEGYSLSYTVPLHSQNGVNWGINKLCTVTDEVFNVNRTLLVFTAVSSKMVYRPVWREFRHTSGFSCSSYWGNTNTVGNK
jgi:hypothetical protein